MNWHEQDDKSRAFLRSYTMRKERYERNCLGLKDKFKERPSSLMYRVEKLTHAFHRGRISKKEYEMQRDMLHKYMKRRGRNRHYDHHYDEFGVVMDDFFMPEPRGKPGPWKRGLGRGPGYAWDLLDDSSSSEEDEERTEEKFAELEAARRKWHEDLELSELNTVYATKRMVANQIILQNDYNVDRITGISKDLLEPVFLTKMAYYAVRMRGAGCVKALIKYGAWVNQPTGGADEKRYTPLHLACKTRQKDCVEVLIHTKAKVDLLDTEGNSCLLLAMHSGCDEDTLKLLLYRSTSSFLTHINNNGENLFHCCGPFYKDEKKKEAGTIDNHKAYDLIMTKAKAKGEARQLVEMREKTKDQTPLHHAAIAESEEKVRILLENGADPNAVATKSYGETPVHIAAERLHAKSLERLLKAGGSLTKVNDRAETPIISAIRNYNRQKIFDVMEVLLEYGAHVHEIMDERTMDTIFHLVCHTQHTPLIELMCQYGASPVRPNLGMLRPLDMHKHTPVYDYLYDEATRMRSLSEICKWKIRESIESGGNIKTVVETLPIPKHLQDFLLTKGFGKPRFNFMDPASAEGAAEETTAAEIDYSEEPRPKPRGVAQSRYQHRGDF